MKPHVLCVNPYIHDFTAYDFWMKPLGLSWLAAYLMDHGYDISFVDCLDRHHPLLLQKLGITKAKSHRNGCGSLPETIIPKPKEYANIKRHYRRYGIPIELFQEILNTIPKPQAILVTSIMTYWYPGVFETIALLREKFPGVPLALGGVYATLCPEHAALSEPDVVISGPGEIKALRWLDQITGLQHEYPSDEILAPEDLPQPYHQYISPGSSAVVATSLGCPLACSYCASKNLQPRFRQRPLDQVMKEILYLAHQKHILNISFYDDALLVNAERHFMPLLEMIIHKNLAMRFHTGNGIHSSLMTPKLAKLMKQAKVETIRFSYERAPVFSPHDTPKVEDYDLAHAMECFREADGDGPRSKIDAYVKAWLPGQTLEEVVDGFVYVNSLGCYIRITDYSPVPGTPDFEKIMQLYGLNGKEPLYHNKTTLPYFLNYSEDDVIQPLKHLANALNHSLDLGINLFSNSRMSKLFISAVHKLVK